MRKAFALLAAAALVPGAAMAQDWHGHHNGGGQGGGRQGSGGQARQAPQQPAAAQPQQAPQPQQRPQGNPGGYGYRGGANGGGRWGAQGGARPQAQAVPQAAAPQQVQPGGYGYRGQYRGGGQPGGYQQGRGYRPDYNAGRAYDRGAGYRQGYNAGGYARPEGYRGGYDRGGGAAAWNRGWRSDSRYDWQRYRYQNREAFHLPRYYAPSGWGYGYRRFGVGAYLSELLFAEDYWIDDAYDYRLPEAYGPYRWVRYYNDALLVDVETGEVVDVAYDIFW